MSDKGTALIYSKDYLGHLTGNLENAERLESILQVLKETKVLTSLAMMEPRMATIAEARLIHTENYLARLAAFTAAGGGMWGEETPVAKDSYDIALLSAGGVLTAVDLVAKGGYQNSFALVRPPGHHAGPSRGEGFCILNNLAIAARYAQRNYGYKKIMIVDWDVHHGNGTQTCFYDDPSVFYFSVHQDGIYPRTGWTSEVGEGEGEGYTINVPVPKGTGDGGYYYIFTKILLPVIQEYQPDLILVAAGFDAHYYDPLASLEVTTPGFRKMTKLILEAAKEVCEGRVVMALEGGYDIASVGYPVAAVLAEMNQLNIKVDDPLLPPPNRILPQMRYRVDEAVRVQKNYWQLVGR